MTKGKKFACTDLGGTRLRIAISDRSGKFLVKSEDKTEKDSKRAILGQIVRIVCDLCGEINVDLSDLGGMGIVSTGPMDIREGVLIDPTNLPFKKLPLTSPIREKLGIPVHLINDSTGGAMGEKRFGAGREHGNLVYVTLSTGIGGGAIVDGRPLFGKDGNAAEIGHIVVDPDGRLKCGCGKRGHWEAYCSGKNLPNFAKMRIKEMDEEGVEDSLLLRSVNGDLSKLSSKILFESAKSGDSLSMELVREIGRINAIGFADLTNIYDPSLITVGGSVALENSKLILEPIREHLAEFARNREPEVKITPLGRDVGLFGALALVLEKSKNID